MAKNKTTPTENQVSDYLEAISDDKRRQDCTTLIQMISAWTGLEPTMWGSSIVGFGSYHYRYESGHEGDASLLGFASRANAIALYIAGESEQKKALLN